MVDRFCDDCSHGRSPGRTVRSFARLRLVTLSEARQALVVVGETSTASLHGPHPASDAAVRERGPSAPDTTAIGPHQSSIGRDRIDPWTSRRYAASLSLLLASEAGASAKTGHRTVTVALATSDAVAAAGRALGPHGPRGPSAIHWTRMAHPRSWDAVHRRVPRDVVAPATLVWRRGQTLLGLLADGLRHGAFVIFGVTRDVIALVTTATSRVKTTVVIGPSPVRSLGVAARVGPQATVPLVLDLNGRVIRNVDAHHVRRIAICKAPILGRLKGSGARLARHLLLHIIKFWEDDPRRRVREAGGIGEGAAILGSLRPELPQGQAGMAVIVQSRVAFDSTCHWAGYD